MPIPYPSSATSYGAKDFRPIFATYAGGTARFCQYCATFVPQCSIALYTVERDQPLVAQAALAISSSLWGGLMEIIQDTEGAEVGAATSTSAIKETILSREDLPKEVDEPPRPWPHDGVVRSWAY